MKAKIKSNWMIEFVKTMKEQEKFYRVTDQYSTYPDVQLKLEQLKQHYSTEACRLNKSDVLRGLIVSFHEITFKEK